MTVLVCYDVPDDKRRTRVAHALEKLGERVQYSVFIVRRATAEEVAERLAALIQPAQDNVRVHPLCAACEARLVALGLARKPELPPGFRIV